MTKNTKVRTHRKVWRKHPTTHAPVTGGSVSRQQARRAKLINTKRRLQALREHDAKANLEAIRAASALESKGHRKPEPRGGDTGITINRVGNWLKRHGKRRAVQ